MSIIIAILVFGLLIFTHELGHFAAAKACGIGVYEFSLGMGPKLFDFTKGGTKYSLRLLPIGGFVQMVGEDEENYAPDSFMQKSIWQRMLVIFSGPFMNFVTAMVTFVIVFMLIGTPSASSVVGNPIEGSPAAAAGIMAGDRIVEINDIEINSWQEMVSTIQAQEAGKPLSVIAQRNGAELSFTITPYFDETQNAWLIGINGSRETTGFFRAIALGMEQTVYYTKLLVVSLWQMLTGQIAPDVAGPVGIVTMVGQVAQVGFANVLLLVGILSVNLGVVNLLPLPALDGSKIVLLAVEGLRGKPMDRNKEAMINLIGFALLMVLMVVITYQDILRLIAN